MNTIELSQEQMLEIAQMAAQLLVTQLQTVSNAHMQVLGATKEFFDQHPEFKGRHKELAEVITRLEKSNPNLTVQQLFELAAEELKRNANQS